MTVRAFYRTVATTVGEPDVALVERATAAVLHALRDRLSRREADQLFAQLPTPLKHVWREEHATTGAPGRMTREQFYQRVKRDAGLATMREARAMTRAVFAALKDQVSPGEAEDVMAQLPKDLKEVWSEARTEV